MEEDKYEGYQKHILKEEIKEGYSKPLTKEKLEGFLMELSLSSKTEQKGRYGYRACKTYGVVETFSFILDEGIDLCKDKSCVSCIETEKSLNETIAKLL